MHPLVDSPSGNGAVVNSGLSLIGCMNIFRSRISKRDDWARLITSAPDQIALTAPKLDSVPFPQVMVARCHAEGETGVSFVLRGPQRPTTFGLGFIDLNSKATYQLGLIDGKGQRKSLVNGIRSDENGRAIVRVEVGDRSEFELLVAT